MFRAIARFSVRFRWPILIFWIAAVPILTASFPKIADVTKKSTQDFLPKNSPTDVASKLESAFQRKDTATNSVIVINRDQGHLSTSDNAASSRLVANVKKVKEVTEVRDLGVS